MDTKITVSEAEESEFREFLRLKIREFNNQKSTFHRESRKPGAVVPLCLMVKNEAGEVIGGLSASTYWNWIEIEKFYFPEDLRGKGIGAALLQTAEKIAVSRGCKSCFLTTHDFQARTFYEKFGYQVVGKLEDYPPGSVYYWMRKDFSPE